MTGALVVVAIRAFIIVMQGRLGFLAGLVLSLGCGDAARSTAVTRDVHSILFVGNSITLHAPAPALGWTGTWGMAASAATSDYSHRFAAHFPGATLATLNISAFETAYRSYDYAALDAELAKTPDVVVVELGDNVTDASGYPAAYDALVARVAARAGLVLCTSTWWRSDATNSAIRTACSRSNTRYVDISGLRQDPSSWAASERSYADAGVGQHPGDRGMQRIADALHDALR